MSEIISEITSLFFEKVEIDFGFKSSTIESGLNNKKYKIDYSNNKNYYFSAISTENNILNMLCVTNPELEPGNQLESVIWEYKENIFILTSSEFYQYLNDKFIKCSFMTKLSIMKVLEFIMHQDINYSTSIEYEKLLNLFQDFLKD